MSPSLRLMGVVTRPHGVRGEVKVRPETDEPSRFDSLRAVYLGDGAETVRYGVCAVRHQPLAVGEAVILGLEGVDDRAAAGRLAGRLVHADEADLPPLGDDEFYLGDLVGLAARSTDGEVLGTVLDVLEMPAQPVLMLARPDGREVLIPFVREFVESVDPAERRLVLRSIQGLLDPDEQEEG